MRLTRTFFLFLIALTACSQPRATAVPLSRPDFPIEFVAPALETAVPEPAPADLPLITLPISVYIIEDENGRLASSRDAAEIEAIYEKVNEIWGQANIVIAVQTIRRLNVPDAITTAVSRGDFRPFFSAAESDFSIPQPSLLNGFYAREIGGANGVVPFDANLFFVMDEPSVHDERVTSHEIGHILGLHHTLADADRLLFSGTNGVTLTGEEIIVARYVAQGLLDRVR